MTNQEVAATDPTRTESLSSGGLDSCIRSALCFLRTESLRSSSVDRLETSKGQPKRAINLMPPAIRIRRLSQHISKLKSSRDPEEWWSVIDLLKVKLLPQGRKITGQAFPLLPVVWDSNHALETRAGCAREVSTKSPYPCNPKPFLQSDL